MKKLLAITLFTFCFYTHVSAQEKGDVEFGFNIGYNSSTVSSTEVTADRSSAMNIGFSADYYFSKAWSIKGKLIHDKKGWDNGFILDTDTGNSFSTDYDLTYLTIPVMANWHFGKTRNWYLQFGPYVGFLTKAEESKFGLDIKDAFNSTDFGLAVGIGVKIPVSKKLKVHIEYDTQAGVANIFKDSNDNVINSRYSFNVGVNFLLK